MYTVLVWGSNWRDIYSAHELRILAALYCKNKQFYVNFLFYGIYFIHCFLIVLILVSCCLQILVSPLMGLISSDFHKKFVIVDAPQGNRKY